jgi:hypothetical protein
LLDVEVPVALLPACDLVGEFAICCSKVFIFAFNFSCACLKLSDPIDEDGNGVGDSSNSGDAGFTISSGRVELTLQFVAHPDCSASKSRKMLISLAHRISTVGPFVFDDRVEPVFSVLGGQPFMIPIGRNVIGNG